MNGAEERKERFVVVQVGEKKFSVLSLDSTSGKPKQYCVQFNGFRWLCNCPHYLKHCEDVNFVCKHIVAVVKGLKKAVEVEINKRVRESRNGNNHRSNGNEQSEEKKPLIITKKKAKMFWNE